MKRFLIILATILTTVPLCAQKTLENDEIIATIGVNVPYIPTVVEIDNNFSVPLTITYRIGFQILSKS